MKKNKNNISVIIPCYNYGRFLEEAVNSVVKQTIKPIEILIADDCSQDNTEHISKKIIKKYSPLISYYKNKNNLGIVKNFNKAVNKTRGDFICILGADNRLKPNYLEETSNILIKNKKVAIAYTDFELFGPRAREVYESFNSNYRGKINAKEQKYIINFPEFNTKTKELQKTKNFIHGSSMYRKKAFLEVKGYIDKKTIAEDQNLFSRIISNGWLAKRVPEPLLEYRQHSENQTNIKLKNKLKEEYIKQQFSKIEELIDSECELKIIKDSKFFKLWPLYCKLKSIFKISEK